MTTSIRVVRGSAIIIKQDFDQAVTADFTPDFPADNNWVTYKIQIKTTGGDVATIAEARLGALIVKR